MREKFNLFKESIKLVWNSAPGWALANTLLSVLRSIFPLVLVLLLKGVIDAITEASSSDQLTPVGNILWPVITVAVVWFLDEMTSDLSNFVRKKQSLKLEVFMYNLLHSNAIKLDLISFEQPEYFDCLTRASREAPWRPNSILNNVVSLFRALISLILMAGLILTLHWSLAILLLVANIPGIWLRLHFAEVLYKFQRKQTPEARKSAYFNWLLTGDRPSRELRLFGLGNYFKELFRISFLKQKEEEINIIRKRTIIELVSNLFKASALFITLLFIARETINKTISLGEMAMFLLAFRQGMIYIKDLFSSLAALYEDSLFIGDTFEFLELKERVTVIEPKAGTITLNKEISAENLSFTYPGSSSQAISNVSFRIEKGEVVALVGANGSGKSTLVRLLCRLYDPDSGTVKFDGTDIRHTEPEEYRKQFSVVFQDFMLYNLSAGENIRLGNIDSTASPERIKSTASAAGVHDLINNLPNGYNTAIGNLFDDSRELSWGEWQKIALARALFREAPVLILDEPSSSLDADTEHEIFRKFREIVRGRTSILISHRFTNVNLADKIIVLDKGEIAETGTHDELMKKEGIYFKMYNKQSSRFNK